MKTLALSLTLVLATTATIANAGTLLTLSNDRNATSATLGIQADAQGNIQKFTYILGDGTTKNFSASQVSNGAVLEEQQGVQALVLTGQPAAGKLAIRYVANGMSGEYKSCNMNLVKDGANYSLQNAYTGGPLRTAKVITWSLGITTIQGLCPAQ